jgi:hypothetical protein
VAFAFLSFLLFVSARIGEAGKMTLGCSITAHQPHNAHNSIENVIFASGLCGRQCVTGSTVTITQLVYYLEPIECYQ